MDKERLKQISAEKAVEGVEAGMVVGLGSGSTVYYALLALGRRVRDGLHILGIPTSTQTEVTSVREGIQLSTLAAHPRPDLTIDGADEIDTTMNLVKGGGGALVRENIIAHASKQLVVIADQSKLVPALGTTFPLPVEIVQFEWESTQAEVNQICGKSTLRRSDEGPLITDNGNFILDCHFEEIPHPFQTEIQLNNIPGVVENGLFVDRADMVIVGTTSGIQIKERSN